MKTLLTFIFFLTSVSLFSQSIIEEKIATFYEPPEVSSIYDFVYDENNGTYVKLMYNTNNENSYIKSNKGDSKAYGYISFYNLIFDSFGNYYVIAGNFNGKDSAEGFFIKNGTEITRYDDIYPSLVTNGKFIYFVATDKGKSFIVKFDIMTEAKSIGKKYDNISLCNVFKDYAHEPEFSLQFTGKGELFYIAHKDNRQFLVINDKEQKSYEEINLYFITEDKMGNLCYIAKDSDSSGTFSVVVQGEKEYGKCFYASGPIIFSEDNLPLYYASDKLNTDETVNYIYKGNEKSRYYEGDVRDLCVSSSGTIGYIAADIIKEDSSSYFTVIDGIEGKKYKSIYNLMFNEEDQPLFIAERNDKYVVVKDNVEQKYTYSNIFSLCVSPEGKICYIGVNFADTLNNKEDEYYYHIGNEKFGPFLSQPYEYEFWGPMILFDEVGRFAFIAAEYSPTSRDTILQKVYAETFIGPGFDNINGLVFYERDLYYHTYSYRDTQNICSVYKNFTKLGGDFDAIYNFKLDKSDGMITFTGTRKNAYYFVKIDL